MTAASVAVVVVHHRTPELLVECLASLRGAAPTATIAVVDTAPEAEFGSYLERAFDAVLWLPTTNHSYSHAVNTGVGATSEPLVALMNADVLVGERTLSDLVGALARDPASAAAGPFALDGRGRPQDLGPAYRVHYLRATRAAARGDTAGAVVPWLSGAFQLVRRSAFEEVGGYDRSLRFTNEDLDFCLKLRRRGHFLRLVDTRVTHLGGSATPRHAAFMAEGRRGGYVISQRYQPPIVQALHRAYLRAESFLGARFARSPEARRASELVAAMLRDSSWDKSPFGATLDDR